MKISIIGPGIMEIPPKGWGAVEILIDEYRTELEKLGWTVQIVNTKDKDEIVREVNAFEPDFVHCQYDEHIDAMSRIACRNKSITSHFGYLEQVWRFPEYYRNFHQKIIDATDVNIFALSPEIAEVYRAGGVPEERLFVVRNGVRVDSFRFKAEPDKPQRSIYLAKVDSRKRQGLIQPMQCGVDFAGNLCPYTALTSGFDPKSDDYLGEWTKESLYNRLTDYANLVLLSDGEAHPLVCMEGMAAGLGLVVSDCATAHLDLSKPFIDVIPESRMFDASYVREVISTNRKKSLAHREEIRAYARQFDWPNVAAEYDSLVRGLVQRSTAGKKVGPVARPSKIAVVTIATGRYFDLFFEDFRASVLSTLAPAQDVTIFCFTDRVNVEMAHVELIRSRFLGWPFDTLMRFELISGILGRLASYDFVLFLDADMKVVQPLDPRYFKLPLVAVMHPGFVGKEGPFEIDPRSAAYVELKDRGVYVQGCVFGGAFASFRYMIKSLRNRVAEDLAKGDIPVWHDESFLNWFVSRNPVTLLPTSYAYPEASEASEASALPDEPVIIHLEKKHAASRGVEHEILGVGAILDEATERTELFRRLYLESHFKVQRLESRVVGTERELRKSQSMGVLEFILRRFRNLSRRILGRALRAARYRLGLLRARLAQGIRRAAARA
ncbi:MAG: hypothetical protein P4M07_10995 [Xanthobacteraceae bacterium]|nr:hypothetical protein [Xanthobacteraceae bacterium]